MRFCLLFQGFKDFGAAVKGVRRRGCSSLILRLSASARICARLPAFSVLFREPEIWICLRLQTPPFITLPSCHFFSLVFFFLGISLVFLSVSAVFFRVVKSSHGEKNP